MSKPDDNRRGGLAALLARVAAATLAFAVAALAGASSFEPVDPVREHGGNAKAPGLASWFDTAERNPALPDETLEGGYASSNGCRACHPGPYASWHASYHRSMTQAAGPETILGDFEDVTLEARGHVTRLERRGDEYRVDLVDPVWFMDPDPNKPRPPPRLELPVVMTTGSHHLQYYWIRRPSTGTYHARPDHGALMSVPWVWMVEEQRWLPVQDSFLTPPTPEHESPLVWNTTCFSCHSVGTQPRYSDAKDEFESRSVELGIACEACHGPADAHLAAHRSPLGRYTRYLGLGEEDDATIVNPTKLSAARSRDVCGQCHSFGEPVDFEQHKSTGIAFRPGDDLRASSNTYRLVPGLQSETHDANPALNLGGNFWPDGTIRVAGREYNGLMETGCATRGELTCLTCHSLHDYVDRADQMKLGAERNETCTSCHPAMASNVEAHTRHPAESSGSQCVNCHMPHTTYGLFVAMRSHRIDSPSAAVQAKSGRPNACNLCHLDQTLGWTNRKLNEWYGQPLASLSRDEEEIASSVLLALRGDAAQRAITAWHFGWREAQFVSGTRWLGAYLSVLLTDPYVAIRRVAQRSLTHLPGYEGFEYDFASPPHALNEIQLQAIARWRTELERGADRSGPRLLLDARGDFDQVTLQRLLRERDHSPIRISE